MRKKIFSSIFIASCWIFFPIGMPLLVLLHFIKTRKSEKELYESLKENSIYPSSLAKVKSSISIRTMNKCELVDSLLFEISSDVSCGLIEKASHTIKTFLCQEKRINTLFIQRFIARQYDLDRSLFEITFALLDYTTDEFKKIWLAQLVNEYPLHFKTEQLARLLKLNLNIKKEPKAILICFLANEHDKVQMLLNHGYCANDLTCHAINYNYSVLDSDGTYFYNHAILSPKTKYFNLLLKDVLLLNGFNSQQKAA